MREITGWQAFDVTMLYLLNGICEPRRRQHYGCGPTFELRPIEMERMLGVMGAIASEVQEDCRPAPLRWQPPRRLAGHDSKVATAGYSPRPSGAQPDG